MSRVQIVRMGSDGLWTFVAHGARFDHEEATRWAESFTRRNIPFKLLLIKEVS